MSVHSFMIVISSGEFSKPLSINFKKSMRRRGFLHGILNLLEHGSRKVGLRRSYASFQPRQSVTQSYMRIGRISSDDPPLCVDSNQTRWDAIFPVFKPMYQPPSSVPPKGNNFKFWGVANQTLVIPKLRSFFMVRSGSSWTPNSGSRST
jgi:hypothetical protein